MLSEDLRKKLRQSIKKNPKEAAKLIEKEPQILEALLNNDEQIIKYINMNSQMQTQLEEKAKELKTTQGVLIGAALLWFLYLLDK